MKLESDVVALTDLVQERIQSNIDVKQLLLRDAKFHALVAQAAIEIVKSMHAGGKVMFFGNEGTAQPMRSIWQRNSRAVTSKNAAHSQLSL